LVDFRFIFEWRNLNKLLWHNKSCICQMYFVERSFSVVKWAVMPTRKWYYKTCLNQTWLWKVLKIYILFIALNYLIASWCFYRRPCWLKSFILYLWGFFLIDTFSKIWSSFRKLILFLFLCHVELYFWKVKINKFDLGKQPAHELATLLLCNFFPKDKYFTQLSS